MKQAKKGLLSFAAAVFIMLFMIGNDKYVAEATEQVVQNSQVEVSDTDTVTIEDEETAKAAFVQSRTDRTVKTSVTIVFAILGMAAIVMVINKVTDTEVIPK
jgi:hypothetical protein